MAYDGLQDFLSVLEKRGELRRIRVEVDPELDATRKGPDEGHTRRGRIPS
jgi:UbiD family decarboxylase